MKVKTNIRAGQGGTSVDSTSTTTSSGVNSGGVNSGGVNSSSGGGKTVVVYYPPVSRCVGY